MAYRCLKTLTVENKFIFCGGFYFKQFGMRHITTKYFKFFLLILLIAFPIFGNLDVLPIRVWDESRLSVNAYQMTQDNDWLVTHYWDGKPEMWNTKPPLLIWCQVLCMKLFGIGELAMRIPSALAALLTCITLLVLSVRYLKDFMFGFIAVMVLITTYGYINVHTARSGDYDSLLTFFTTISSISYFAYSENRNNKYLYFFFLCLAFGVLTKSVSALFFTPPIIIYTLYRKQFISLLKNKHTYFGVLIFLSIVLGYYLIREHYNPGYIDAVTENELGGRYLNTLVNGDASFWFYYTYMLDEHLTSWYLLVPCGLLVGIFSENKKIKNLTLFSTILILFFFVVISTAKTKLNWYDCPLFPFIAIIITVFIHYVFIYSKSLMFKNNEYPLKYNLVPYLFLFFILINPYQKIINKTYYNRENQCDEDLYQISYYIRSAIEQPERLNDCYLLIEDTKDQFFLYLKILKEQQVNVSYKNREDLKVGDAVVVWEQRVKDYITAKYNYEVLENFRVVTKYRLISEKEKE